MTEALKITIAIDGFSSTGKSTVAKQLAEKLGYVYVDSGAMYRAVTLFALQKGFIGKDFVKKNEIIAHLHEINLDFVFNKERGFAEMFLNNENVENEIRSILVSDFVSEIAKISEVRVYLVAIQRRMGDKKGVIMDGRDIGSVVFPDAELKVFITADPNVRAERRWLELRGKGQQISLDQILENVMERDRIDSTREVSPLIKVKDAVELDVTFLTKKQQFDTLYHLALERIEQKKTAES